MRFLIILILVLSLTAAMVYGVVYVGTHLSSWRTLTEDEKQYVTTLFGNNLDYAAVRIHFNTPFYTIVSSLSLGNSVHFKLSDANNDLKENLTISSSGRFMLVHELTHVYQFQHGGWDYLVDSFASQLHAQLTTGSRLSAYDWRNRLSDNDSFESWNPEEQAEAFAEMTREYDLIQSGSKTRDTSIRTLSCTVPFLIPTYCSTK
jgi:hypothetical protein